MPTMRRMFVSAGRTLPDASKRNATPGTSTRSSHPLSIAGGPLHHVGYTNTSTSARCTSAAWEAVIGSTSGRSEWYAWRSAVVIAGAKPMA